MTFILDIFSSSLPLSHLKKYLNIYDIDVNSLSTTCFTRHGLYSENILKKNSLWLLPPCRRLQPPFFHIDSEQPSFKVCFIAKEGTNSLTALSSNYLVLCFANHTGNLYFKHVDSNMPGRAKMSKLSHSSSIFKIFEEYRCIPSPSTSFFAVRSKLFKPKSYFSDLQEFEIPGRLSI